MTAGRMKVTFAQAHVPSDVDWKVAPTRWISLTNVRLNGGLFFTKPTVPVEALFYETWSEEMPRLLEIDDRLYVVSGEVTFVRAILDGLSGVEARVHSV